MNLAHEGRQANKTQVKGECGADNSDWQEKGKDSGRKCKGRHNKRGNNLFNTGNDTLNPKTSHADWDVNSFPSPLLGFPFCVWAG